MDRVTSVEWSSTTACNLRCRHCAASAGLASEGELDTSEALDLVKQVAGLGAEHFGMNGGEFTSRPDWQEILASALELLPNVSIITNGTLGRRLIETCERLPHPERLTIIVSLDGRTEAHEARRGSGSWSPAAEVLRTSSQLRRDVITTIDVLNFSELEAIERFCLDCGVSRWNVQPAMPYGRMPRENFLGDAGLRSLADFVHASRQRCGQRLGISSACFFGYFHPMMEDWSGCPAGRGQLSIRVQGDVTGCLAIDSWVCGNIRKRSLREIVNSPEMEAVASTRPESCAGCSQCDRGCQWMHVATGRQYCWAPGSPR